jgi:hypothetical protein
MPLKVERPHTEDKGILLLYKKVMVVLKRIGAEKERRY